ncbi:MAG: DUF3987 domain-containing protein [Rhodobacteraceae bacterium]|nr:DUF3987 domain-containing protein [Paracoccaceae bacterium]
MTTDTISDTFEYAKSYDALGWALVNMPAGSKAPTTFSWQTRAISPDHWVSNPTHNVGLLHGLSGTCALDIDHMENTRAIFEALNIDLDALLSSAPRIVGRPDRGKVLFAIPAGAELVTRKISWPVQGNPRKTEVVFELRAGSVQDVLPPSIHPDTGNPYTWAGRDWRQPLPSLPDQLLTIWTEWDRFRPQMIECCPWAVRTFTPPPKQRQSGQQESVIDAYNAMMPMAQALEKAGYKQFGMRWLSPNSSSKIPGVVIFDDGRAYSHHASDPFDPAHSFDAFDVFCHYEHLGNTSAAVKAAVDIVGMDKLPASQWTDEDREMIRHGREVWEAISAKAAPDAEGDIPRHLLTVPGVLGEAVAYSAKTAIKPQPQFDVQMALALGSVVMGRRFVTSNRNMTSLYFLNVGKTGSGKEHANTVIEDCLEAADCMHLRGPSGYTSSAAVLSVLNEKPSHIAVIDEFGSMLASASAKGNQHKKDALTMLMEAWGRQTKTLRNVGYSMMQMNDNQKKSMQIEIRNPSLTIIGMTTPETFYEAIGARDVASGFLNRILIVESKRPRELSRNPKPVDVPSKLVEWIKETSTAQGGDGGLVTDQGAEFPPIPVMIPFSDQAISLLRDYEITLTDRQNAAGPMIADMMNRSREIAMRLSLIVAGSLGDSEITAEAAQWAIDYVDFYLRQTLSVMDVRISEGDTDGLRKAIAQAIKDAGSTGLKMAELLKEVPRLGNLKKHERDGLLAMVIEDYDVVREVLKPEGGKGGRPAIIHRWADGPSIH